MVARLRALDRKLARDLWHLRGQVAAIGVVVACGVAIVVTTRTTYTSLLVSRAAYYGGYRFGDVFAHLKRAPEALRPRLAAIRGVEEVQTRVVTEVTLDVPGLAEPAIGRLVSVPERRQPMLNDLHLRRGRWLEPGRSDEVIVSEAFALANGLDVGSALGAVINSRWERLRIVGVALSPEYVYQIAEGGLFPDNRRFGVLWMSREALGPAFDMVGAFNDVALTLAPGAVEADVIARVDRVLERYGGLGAYGRGEQVSARFLNDEIAQNRVSGTVIPAIFLGVAAFLLNVVLVRLVSTEREQIGALKAFGYEDWAVGWHYLKLALVALFIGAVVGIALGLWFAGWQTAQYAEYYRFPKFVFRFDLTAVALAVLVTLVAAVTAAAGAVRRVVALPPATAMQPEPPARFRAGPVERLGLHRLLAVPGRIIARDLERRPVKAALSALGIAFAVAILVVGRFFVDAMRYMADVQFRHVQRENLTLVFNAPRSPGVRHELARLPGVLSVETFRSVPARLRAGHRSRRTALLGLEEGGELRRLVGRNLAPVALPPDGLVLTAKLGEILHVAPGDTLTVEALEGARPVRRVPVAGFVDELLGLSAYMDQRALNRMMWEGNTLSGAFLGVDPLAAPALYERLKRLPGVAGVSSRDAALASFEETLAQSIGLVTGILIGFAGALAVAMVYNAARIALSERGRELASLRVLGFTRGEIALMLLGEQGILAGVGIVAGLAIGYGFCTVLSRLYQWEIFRIPLVVSVQTYAFAVTVILGAAAASALLVRRRLDRLDLVAVLKTRE
ncbi:MAG TPA: FtsX-like permease family protein [Gemmatimonadales bacterium]|nr:FtsX-like permease family protein [Gemmatimonadales bacterium]